MINEKETIMMGNKYPPKKLKKYEPFNISDYIEVGDGIDASEVDKAAQEMSEAKQLVLFNDYVHKELNDPGNDPGEGNLCKISEFELMLILLKRVNEGTFSIEKHVDDNDEIEYYIRYFYDCKKKYLTSGHDTIYKALESFVNDNSSIIFNYADGHCWFDFESWCDHNAYAGIKITYEGQD